MYMYIFIRECFIGAGFDCLHGNLLMCAAENRSDYNVGNPKYQYLARKYAMKSSTMQVPTEITLMNHMITYTYKHDDSQLNLTSRIIDYFIATSIQTLCNNSRDDYIPPEKQFCSLVPHMSKFTV